VSDLTIGASEAAAALGLSPYQSAYQWWAQKTGRVDRTQKTEAIRIGKALEDAIAHEFERTFDVRLQATERLSHPTAPWMHATPDRFLTREGCSHAFAERFEVEGHERIPVEIKTARIAHLPTRKDEGEWGTEWSDQIPQVYGVQVQSQMEVTNAVGQESGDWFTRRAFLFALVGNRGFVPFAMTRLPEVQAWIVEGLEQIAGVNLVLDVPLQPETADDWDIAADIVTRKSGGKVRRTASHDEAEVIREYHAIKKEIDVADIRRAELRARILSMIGGGYAIDALDQHGAGFSALLTEGSEGESNKPRKIVDDIVEALPSFDDATKARIAGIIKRHTTTFTSGRQLRVTEKKAKTK
jgi:putative phage-type endonuclease